MDATELFHKDGRPAGVWYCGKCRCITGDRTGGRDAAEKCCAPKSCPDCGAELPRRSAWTVCEACRRTREAQRERERFEKAKKIAPGEEECWLYHDPADKWFRDLDEFEEWLEDDPERVRPAYLWCSTLVKWCLDLAGYVADHVHDNFHEDAGDQFDSEALKELGDFGEQWWEKHGVQSWEIDYSRCVLLAPRDDANGEPADGYGEAARHDTGGEG